MKEMCSWSNFIDKFLLCYFVGFFVGNNVAVKEMKLYSWENVNLFIFRTYRANQKMKKSQLTIYIYRMVIPHQSKPIQEIDLIWRIPRNMKNT